MKQGDTKIYTLPRVLQLGRLVFGILFLIFSLAGCGNHNNPSRGNLQDQVGGNLSEYVYVADYMEIAGNVPTGTLLYHDGYFYREEYNTDWDLALVSNIFRMSLSDHDFVEIPFNLEDNWQIYEFIPADDGNLYCLIREPKTEGDSYYFLKYDFFGNELYQIPISEYLWEDMYGISTAVDSRGRIYVYTFSEDRILLFDEMGVYYGDMEADGRGVEFFCDGEGRVCLLGQEYNGSVRTKVMAVIDFEEKTLGQAYKNIPIGEICRGSENRHNGFFIKTQDCLYEYDCSSQQAKELLKWEESDLVGDCVEQVAELSDGRLLVIMTRGLHKSTAEREVAFLTKTKRDQIRPKEELVIGMMGRDHYSLQTMIAEFNKKSDKYRITIRAYEDYDNKNDSLTVGRENLQMDIITGNEPDIYYLADGLFDNIESFAAKGLFEDLDPYLDRSENYDREDFVDAVLEGNTYSGALISIPPTFRIRTMVGRTSQIGSEAGWTISDLMAYINTYPEACITAYGISPYSREGLLEILLRANSNFFINRDTGECCFASEEFIQLLECTKKYQPWSYDEFFEDAIRENKELLNVCSYDRADRIEEMKQLFGGDEVTFIGYPTLDGMPGHQFVGTCCAISARSEHKEGAWAFLEFVLDHASVDEFGDGLLSEKKKLEQQIDEAVSNPYETDEDGRVVLDADGEPIRRVIKDPVHDLEWYAPLPEDRELIWELVSSARPCSAISFEVINVIYEEAAAYYVDQKTAEDVADVIQKRVQVYVDENR